MAPTSFRRIGLPIKILLAAAFAVFMGLALVWFWVSPPVALVTGIFWQPDRATAKPEGIWHQIGARQLVVQWTAVDDRALWADPYLAESVFAVDWEALRQQPWAQQITVGLTGHNSEMASRNQVDHLARLAALNIQNLPLPAAAYYFPVEVDPTWQDTTQLSMALNRLPRPLWISLYAQAAVPDDLSTWLKSWLPDDVCLFVQDGVGVGVRSAEQALQFYLDIKRHRPEACTALIAEAFRTREGEGFRGAYPWELAQQLDVYRGESIFLFDGPHYVGYWDVLLLKLWTMLRAG